MTKRCIPLFAGILASLSLLGAAPLSSLVEDDVALYFSLRSVAESREDWAGHPITQLIESQEMQDFFQPLLDLAGQSKADEENASEILKNEFGLTWDELFELFPGESALAWYNLPEWVLGQADRPELVLMAEYAGEPVQLEALLQVQFDRNAESQKAVNPAIEHRLIEESFMGETLYFDEVFDGESTYIEDGYALVEGLFILATPEARLRSAVEAIKEEPEAPLSENGAYLRSREEGGRGDLQLYVNLEAILPLLNAELMRKAMASGAAMFGISAQSLDAALSLESSQALFFDIDLVESELRMHSGLIYREKAGLLRLISYSGQSLPDARYVPEGVFSTSVTNFDFGQMLAQLETLITTASPMMRIQIDAQLQTVRTSTGVDLRSSFLENFGGDLVTLSILPEEGREAAVLTEPDQLILLALKDGEALSAGLEALKDLVPGMREQIETKEFAGHTIHTIRTVPDPGRPEAASTVSYVITRSQFILSIGRLGLLQNVLRSLETGDDGFWQMAETETLFEKIARPDAVSRSYVDLEKWMQSIFESIVQMSQLGGNGTALDMERIPKNLAAPFHLISEMNEADDGMFTRALILQKGDAQ